MFNIFTASAFRDCSLGLMLTFIEDELREVGIDNSTLFIKKEHNVAPYLCIIITILAKVA